jgi:glyoxylase-like metal-dependent hydrolase (beta-lactamase superfamily II)
MRSTIIPCGFLKVRAADMIQPLSQEEIALKYEVDKEGYMKLSMNALLVEDGERKVLFDPGTADFLPLRIRKEYGLEIPVSLEDTLLGLELLPAQVTDVVFTHLHFDHASGGFRRVPGNIVKRFPQARYHVLKEHYEYATDPDPVESDSFSTGLLKYLDRIYWLEDWDLGGISFRIFNGHTRGMAVPVIPSEERTTYFMSDLVPMEIFLKQSLWCGYDLEPDLLLREKQEFLREIPTGSNIIFYHETLKDSVLYQ